MTKGLASVDGRRERKVEKLGLGTTMKEKEVEERQVRGQRKYARLRKKSLRRKEN
jgi:hypothetical protein